MRSPRILVVDDDRFFRDLFLEALVQPGWDVVAVADAASAAPELARGVDVLVTDLVLPGESGLELARRAKAATPALEVIVVTQRDEVRSAVEAMQAGAADYLVKPVERAALVLAVRRALERGALRRDRERLMGENLELSRNQALYRRCLSLLTTLDQERVHDLSLQTLTGVSNAQSGALWTADERGELVLRGFRGLVDRSALPSRLDPGEDALLDRLSSGAAFTLQGRSPGAAFHVPLIAAGETQGLALLADPLAGAFRDEEARLARAVADFAAAAVRNARRFSQVERVGLRDRDTAVYNLSFFIDYASKEIYKARRYGRVFSLITLTLDNLDALSRSLSREDLARLTRGILGGVSRITRDADVVARVADNEFYILLPETDAFGAWMFRRRAREAARADRVVREIEARLPVAITIGLASFPRDGLDFDELLHHCRGRAEEDRRSPVRGMQLESRDFWSSVDALLTGEVPPSRDERLPCASRRGELPRGLMEVMQAEVARGLVRDEQVRGVLYVVPGAEGVHGRLPVLGSLGSAEPASRVYVLGRRGASPLPPGPATAVYLDGDERIAGHELLLLLTETTSYALLRRTAAGEAFHTSDAPLVDHLVAGLQRQYELQPF